MVSSGSSPPTSRPVRADRSAVSRPCSRRRTPASCRFPRSRIAAEPWTSTTSRASSAIPVARPTASPSFPTCCSPSNSIDRAKASGARLVSVAAHPGIAATGFVAAIGLPKPITAIAEVGANLVGQSAERGALPGLYAASMPDIEGGAYWGPDGIGEIRGWPKRAALSPHARDAMLAAQALGGVGEADGCRLPPARPALQSRLTRRIAVAPGLRYAARPCLA